jgi:glycosyltransferase involved in cell wall biosynthesis
LGKPVSVIPYGLDTSVFAPRDKKAARSVLGIPQDARVVLFVSSSFENPRKGMQLLTKALAAFEARNDLVLISLGEAQSFKLPGNMQHLPLQQITDDRFMSLVYSAADIFVQPSLQDNLPNTVMESLACGTPVVGCSIGGIPDMVQPGQTGLLVEPNAEALHAGITELLENPGRLEIMAGKAREIALARYSIEIQARRYYGLYQNILSN